jgi:endonuclease/exonuclease/phosphatase (EEP) superfamily protein YafD
MDSFSHFLHYYCLAFLVIAVLAVLFKLRGPAIVAFASLVCASLLMGPAKPFSFALASGSDHTQSRSFKILTFNLLYANEQRQAVADYIRQQSPDVILLQEVSPINRDVIDLLSEYKFVHRCWENPSMENVVLSRIEPVAQDCLPNVGAPWMDVSVNGRIMRMISIHLNWPWPFGQWQRIDDLQYDLAALAEDQPIVVGGDFNAVPWSAAVRTVEEITGSSIVPGFRFTFYGYNTPFRVPVFVPIDQILLPEGTNAQEAIAGPEIGSDHRPVTITFTVNN